MTEKYLEYFSIIFFSNFKYIVLYLKFFPSIHCLKSKYSKYKISF